MYWMLEFLLSHLVCRRSFCRKNGFKPGNFTTQSAQEVWLLKLASLLLQT
jgi:hypothetical protein